MCLFFWTAEDPPVTHRQRTSFIKLTKWRENNFGLWDDENKLIILFFERSFTGISLGIMSLTNSEQSCCWKELEGISAGDYQSTAVVKLTILNASECAWDFVWYLKQKLFIFCQFSTVGNNAKRMSCGFNAK